MSTELQKVITLTDLYSDTDEAIKQNALNVILNSEPKKEWLKEHPTIKYNGVPHVYLPIERIEYLLTRIFLKWRVEVMDTKLIANSVCVTVRLFVLNPLDGEWMWNDGVGASAIQIDKGQGAIDFNQMKSAAIQMALPAAKSYAISDAADHFGKIFGKDLNRKTSINYGELVGRFDPKEEDFEKNIKEEIASFHNIDDLDAWFRKLPDIMKNNDMVKMQVSAKRNSLTTNK